MFEPSSVISLVCLYMGALFLVALLVEKRVGSGRGNPVDNPVVYSLSLAIYCTAWTFYGSVGMAANSGMLFVTTYLGPTLAIILWWTVFRKLIHIRNTQRITSIADFISSRYDKSQSLAALVTILALVGSTPYIALQLRAVTNTFTIITSSGADAAAGSGYDAGWLMVALMILFTILFGVRRVDPTERHQGIVAVVAVESVVKLTAFLAAGLFVSLGLFDGPGDILDKFSRMPMNETLTAGGPGSAAYMSWMSFIVLSMSAIMFLPRQFHVGVIENFRASHVRTAMWLFPAYLLLISLFVIPIAMAGLIEGYPASIADSFVLRLPLDAGQRWLSLFVFIGGFSASTSMVMISTMTLSVMVTNHLMLPLVNLLPGLGFLRKRLLQCRWGAVALGVVIGYLFARSIGESFILMRLGVISFGAALQFAPAIIGGLFWTRGNKAGAQMGLAGGFAVWCYTMLLPAFIRSGWLSPGILEQGPWGVGLLAPESLFGLSALDPVSNMVLWSLFFNVGLYVLGSSLFRQPPQEERLAREFVNALTPADFLSRPTSPLPLVDLQAKRELFHRILTQFFSGPQADAIIDESLKKTGLEGSGAISITRLADLATQIENTLSGSIGAAAAHVAIKNQAVFTPAEEDALAEAYGDVLANLKLPPEELKRKIDYHLEREALLQAQAEEVAHKVELLQAEIEERKRVEAALIESRGKMYAIFDQSYQSMGLLSIDGAVLEANRAALKFVGVSEDQVLGKPLWATPWWQHSEWEQERLKEAIEKAAEGEFVRYETTNRTADDKVNFVDFSLLPVRDERGEVIYLIAEGRDITDRKRAEQALLAGERYLRTLLETNPDLMLRFNRNGDYTYFNRPPFFADDFQERELVGINMHEVMPRSVIDERMILAHSVWATGRPEEHEYVVRMQGEPRHRWAKYVKWNQDEILATIRDVTERKKIEMEKQTAADIVNAIPSGLFIFQVEEPGKLIVLEANPEAQTLAGHVNGGLTGKEMTEIWPTATAFNLAQKFLEAARTGREYSTIDLQHGRETLEKAFSVKVFPMSGQRLGVSVEDILSRKQAEQDRERLQNQLRQSQKMEAIGTLAGGIAHDFNNILGAVMGYTELAMYKAESGEENLKDLREVLKAGERARDLVKQILSFSRQAEKKRMPIEIGPVVKEALKLLRASLPTTMEIRQHIEERPGVVLADPTQIHQVVMNICTNASHAMRDQAGVLDVSLARMEMDEHAAGHYAELEAGVYLRLSISDTGSGMGKETLEHIFEPFFTTKKKGEGTGMGLSVVHGIVRSHEGAITVYSEPGSGSVFNIYLPVVETEQGLKRDSLMFFDAPTGTEHIILVDDEKTLVEINERMLASLGYRVTATTSSEEALAMVERDPHGFDLMITDQTMPHLTGLQLAEQAHAIHPGLPIIICTGFSEQVTEEGMERGGIDRLLLKPVTRQQLASNVREVLDNMSAR